MLGTWARRAVAPTAIAAAILLPATSYAATVTGETGSAVAASSTRVVATSTGWAHTISGMAGHLCARSTPALWAQIARDNGIGNPDRIGLGQTIEVRCAAAAGVVVAQATAPKPTTAKLATPPTATASWVNPLPGTRCVSGWGAARDGGARRHKGIDLIRSGVRGQPIRAVHSGRVVLIRYSVRSSGLGAGWYVMVDHGTYQSVYMHMRGRSPLAVGARVKAGQTIGYVGSTGAGVAHLHFEIHRGRWNPVSPAPFLRAHGIAVRGC